MLTDDPDRSLAARRPLATRDPQGEDSLTAELRVRPRRRLLTPAFAVLLSAVALAGGFLAGVLVEKGQQEPSGSGAGGGGFAGRLAALREAGGTSARGAGGSAASGSAGGASEGGGPSAGGRATAAGAAGFVGRSGGSLTVGQVAFVQKGTLYVTDLEGNTVKVTTSRASRVTKTVSASVKSIHPGETVLVTGAVNAQGVIGAETIRVGGGASGGLGAGGGLAALLGGRSSSGGEGPRSARLGGSRPGGQAGGSQSGGEVALFGKGG